MPMERFHLLHLDYLWSLGYPFMGEIYPEKYCVGSVETTPMWCHLRAIRLEPFIRLTMLLSHE